MGKRVAGILSSLRSRIMLLPAIIGTTALALFIVVAFARREPATSSIPSARPLSNQIKERLDVKAHELAPQASLYFSFVEQGAEAFAKLDANEIDEAALLDFCKRVVDGSDAFVREFSGEVKQAAAAEGAPAAEIQRYLSEKLRALDRGETSLFRILPGVSPAKLGILAAPRPPQQSGNGLGPEAAKVKAIQHLLEILAKLPPQSNGAHGVENAILAMRQAIIPFDKTPIVVTFTSPSPGAIDNFIPAIAFTMTDTGSGPNPDTRQLLAINNGPVTTGTTDLTGLTTVTLNDQVHGIVKVAATNIPPNTIQDGFITLQASGTDFANNPPTVATLPFVLDRVPPVISVLSPISGSNVSTTTVPLSSGITDTVSGVALNSIKVILNGADITVAITQTPGPANSLGAPNAVQLAGSLAALPGSNVLVVSASDLAGNPASVTVIFQVQVVPQISGITLSIVSGDGQEGLVGRGATDDLVVSATDTVSGQPVPGVELIFSGQTNTGTFGKSASSSLFTDANGQGAARYVYSPLPGENVVKVTANLLLPAGDLDFAGVIPSQAVQFHLTGKLPKLDNVTTIGPCNFNPSTFDFPGSAVATLFTARASKPDGSPLKGEIVRPFISSYQGTPPTANAGRFIPARRVTDDFGEAKFAFVIDINALPGPFTMQFGLPDFRDADDKEVSFSVAGGVNSGSRDPIISSGQGQIGVTSSPLAQPLVAQTSVPNGAITFTVIEGSGKFVGPAIGNPSLESVNPCGQPFWVIFVGPGGTAGIIFQKISDIALVAIGPGSDVFAVGPTEVSVAIKNPSGQFVGVPNVLAMDSSQPDPTIAFQILAKVPKGQSPTSSVTGFNSFGEMITSIKHAVAPTSLDSSKIMFQKADSESTDAFDAFVSQPLGSTTDLLDPEEVATGGGGTIPLIETTPFGEHEIQVSVGGEQVKMRVREGPFKNEEVNTGNRPLIFYKTYPGAGTPNLIGFTFTLSDKQQLDSVLWLIESDDQSGTNRNSKTLQGANANQIFVNFIDGGSDFTRAGSASDPVQVNIAENNTNRRKEIFVTTYITYKNEKGAKATLIGNQKVRIALNNPATGTRVPAKNQDGLASIKLPDKTFANWDATILDSSGKPIANPNIPTSSSGKVVVFAPIAGDPNRNIPPLSPGGVRLLSGLNTAVGGPVISLANHPLSFFIEDPPFPAPALTTGQAGFSYGTIVSAKSWDYDAEVIADVVAHEKKHVITKADLREARDTLYFRINQSLLLGQNGPNPLRLLYLDNFEHSKLIFESLNGTISYRFIRDAVRVFGNAPGAVVGQEQVFVESFNNTVLNLVRNQNGTVAPGAQLEAGTVTLLKDGSAAITTLDWPGLVTIYKQATKKFPELKDKDEFEEQRRLLRPDE